MNTTLKKIREYNPCADGWAKLLRHLGKTEADDEPLPLREILDSNGLDDALWCLRAVPNCDREARLFAVWCARQVQHLMTDPRSIFVIDVAERHANSQATDAELAAARYAAWDAARDAEKVGLANHPAADAAWTAEAAAKAAWAAWGAVRGAARAAAAAAWTAGAAAEAKAAWAAWAAARQGDRRGGTRAAAWDAAIDARRAKFVEMFCTEDKT